MINLLLLSIALVLYSKRSEKISNTKILQVIGLYIGSQVLLVTGLLADKPILLLLLITLYIDINQRLLFNYESKVSYGIHTLIYLVTILVTPIIYKDVVSYQIGLNSPLFANMTTLVLVTILGYINVIEKTQYRNIFAAVLMSALLLNGLVYNSFYSANISNSDIVSIETCEQLTDITNNHYYELKNDIDCTDTEMITNGRIAPYKININGHGYTISNLKLTTNNTRINGQSEITNIRFDNSNIDGNGLLAINYGAIKQIAVTNSTIKGTENIGGIVGVNYGSISDSYSAANTIEGTENVGGIAGTNYGEIENVYSTSFVDGYEYVGGLVGKQSKPGHIQNSFYDDRFVPEETISKGALVIIGQDRETMEVIDGFKDSEVNYDSLNNYYKNLNNNEQQIVNEAYKTDTQDWHLLAGTNSGTIDNIVVLSNEDYTKYENFRQQGEFINLKRDLTWKANFTFDTLTSISDEYTEENITLTNIRVLPADYYNQTNPGLYSSIGFFMFNPTIWDEDAIDSNSAEPLKLV